MISKLLWKSVISKNKRTKSKALWCGSERLNVPIWKKDGFKVLVVFLGSETHTKYNWGEQLEKVCLRTGLLNGNG